MSPRQNVIDETDNMTRQTIDPKQAIDPRHGWVRYTSSFNHTTLKCNFLVENHMTVKVAISYPHMAKISDKLEKTVNKLLVALKMHIESVFEIL